jgi:hypothetical protein
MKTRSKAWIIELIVTLIVAAIMGIGLAYLMVGVGK